MLYDYSDEEIKKLNEEYYNLIPVDGISWQNFAEKLNSLQIEQKNKIYFQRKILDDALNQYCGQYLYYPKKGNEFCSELKKIILNTIKLLPKDYYFWWSVYYFFKNDKKNLEKTLDKYFAWRNFAENPVDEVDFVQNFLDVYKNAYRGFWEKMSERFKKLNCTEAENLCNLFENFYYNCKTDEEKINLFQNYIQDNPETILAKEFLGYFYEDKKLWYNAISVFEQVAGKSVFYYYADIYFSLGWFYGKVKEYKSEEENYRKCLEENSAYEWALNNLGYCLYKQRKFDEAEKIFFEMFE